MLSPDQIEEAGERVAAVYREIEARMLDHLARAMAEGWEKSPRTVTEAALLAQSQAEELRRMVEEFRPYIDAAVLEVVEECLEASDEDDVARAGGSPEWPAQIDATVKGMAEVLGRDNIQMAEGAKQAFLGASIEAVTRVNSGDADREAALHRAVRKLERDGIDIVTYQDADTGRVTVRSKADVAVRRHVRTQIAQDAQRMTMARMERLGIDLVEVSSHSDSRPSHAEWQGRCYSLKGEQVIDGVRYPDFYLHCMSGDLGDILGGVNCRHSYGPYRHGAPRMYEPDPQHPSGLLGAEVYELEQGQRYRERKIREAKRELRGAQVLYERDKSAANLDAVNKAGQKLRNRQEKMRAYIDGANAKSKTGKPVLHRKPDREWAGDMPKSKMPASANRTLPQLLGTPSAKRAMAGLDSRAVTAAVGEEMARRGGTVAHFRSLSPGEQQGVLRGAIASVRAKMDGTAKASRGMHAARTAIDRSAQLYSSLGTRHVDKIADIVNHNKRPVAKTYLTYEGRLRLVDHKFAGTPHFDPEEGGVSLNADRTLRDRSRPPMTTWFHEFGHNIDYISTGDGDWMSKALSGMKFEKAYASTAYKDGLFSKTIRREVDDMIEKVETDLVAKYKRAARAYDIDSLYKDGFLPAEHYDELRDMVSNFGNPEWFSEMGLTRYDTATLRGQQTMVDQYISLHVRMPGRSMACEQIADELNAMPDARKCDLSDILEGASDGDIIDGYSHIANDPNYWDAEGYHLAHEAFAEMFSARMCNPDSMEMLEKYLPDSVAVFDDIINAIQGGRLNG